MRPGDVVDLERRVAALEADAERRDPEIEDRVAAVVADRIENLIRAEVERRLGPVAPAAAVTVVVPTQTVPAAGVQA